MNLATHHVAVLFDGDSGRITHQCSTECCTASGANHSKKIVCRNILQNPIS